MGEREAVAELQRLRAFVARTAPIVKAALELRALGRSIDELDEEMLARGRSPYGTRSATPFLIMEQAYKTALTEFDQKVKDAALGEFTDLIDPTSVVKFEPRP